jgi:hypothetical protein
MAFLSKFAITVTIPLIWPGLILKPHTAAVAAFPHSPFQVTVVVLEVDRLLS